MLPIYLQEVALLQVKSQTPAETSALRQMLRDFYGRQIQHSDDLITKACCTDDTARQYGHILELLPDEVRDRQYGCGCPLPVDPIEGLHVLDLGSGAGVDAFLALHRVGPQGSVQGVDMTHEQLEIARRNAPLVRQRFGHERDNVHFHEDFIETADRIEDSSIDLVISDCVINLSPAKEEVFRTIWRVLKPGGEFYVSDIAADRRVPEAIRQDPRMVAECLGGAEYEHDWFDQIRNGGFLDPRVVSRRVVQEEAMGEAITFYSLNVRGFKLETMDRRCEDYGQTATYLGSVPGAEARYWFDNHHVFEKDRPSAVCRNTARMLSETRLGRDFAVTQPIRHFGLFDCAPQQGSDPRSAPPCC